MLTETQFKVLMILFDDQGHAGWQLAEVLGMEESNLNPLLKRLEKKNFIFQGPPRKSNRPKKPKGYKKSKNVEKVVEIEKRAGDYKEFPYYINKNLKILSPLVKEMVVTNESHDIGFPYRIIRASGYMKSMREIFGENFNKCLAELIKNLNISEVKACAIARPVISDINELMKMKMFHLLNFQEDLPQFKDRRISKKALKELEIWWLRYDLSKCLSEDPFDIKRLVEIRKDIPWDCLVGEDVEDAIEEALNRASKDEKEYYDSRRFEF